MGKSGTRKKNQNETAIPPEVKREYNYGNPTKALIALEYRHIAEVLWK